MSYTESAKATQFYYDGSEVQSIVLQPDGAYLSESTKLTSPQSTEAVITQTIIPAEIISPTPGTNFVSFPVNFDWTDTGASNYILRIGSTSGGSNYFSGNTGSNTSATVSGLPNDKIVYVDLLTQQDPGGNTYWVKSYVYNLDVDNDGIKDSIDPDPTTTNGKIQYFGNNYTLTLLGSGRVANLEISSAIYDELAVGTTSPHIKDLTRTILQHLGDNFDFILFANDQQAANTGTYGTYLPVKNDTAGIGAPMFDNTYDYGSAGSLQGVIHFPRIGALRGGPSLHELTHRWAHYLGSVTTDAVSMGLGHWGFSSVGGQLGGWDPASFTSLGNGLYQATNGDPRFTSFGLIANGGNSIPYSELELYLMGLIPLSQVPDIMIAQNPVWVDQANGIFSADGFTNVPASDILSVDGTRVPDYLNSINSFRAIYVVLSKVPLSNLQWASYDEDVYDFSLNGSDGYNSSQNFWEATGGHATIKMDGLTSLIVQPTPHFVFGSITSPQAEDQSFSVNITTVDDQGDPLSFSGKVSLSSNGVQPVYPTSVTIVNGAWSGDVTVYGGGVDVRLHAAAAGGAGDSAPFEVSGQTSAQGLLRGDVKDHQGQLLDAADVYLDKDGDGTDEYTETTDSSGRFSFPPIPPGQYTVWAEYGSNPRAKSTVQKVSLSAYGAQNAKLVINTYSGKIPVLLVPGILESTRSTFLWTRYPSLRSWYPNSEVILDIHDPVGAWKDLRSHLISQGYTDSDIVEAPYDWRMPVSEVADEYLYWAIQRVKSATGSPQVDIIAHSTGGLVVRSYIQRASYPGDIRKFAMVGTPNEGAVNMYYIWAGGNPKWADDLNDSCILSIGCIHNFYWNTIENLYSTHNKKGKLRKKDNIKIWEFLHSSEYGPIRLGIEGKELMPTFPYLKYNGQDWPVTSGTDDGNLNSTLIDMNNDPNRDRMSPDGSQGTVETSVFYSESEKTVKSHSIVNPAYIPLYQGLWRDGKRDVYADPEWGVGDGTVLKRSATLPSLEGWADIVQIPDGRHHLLVSEGRALIANFLTTPVGGQAQPSVSISSTSAPLAPQATTIAPILSLNVSGRVRPYLEIPGGLADGVDPTSGEIVENIPAAELILEADFGGVSLETPDNGLYSVSITGYAQEEVEITLSYFDDTNSADQRYWLFHHGDTSSFTFQLDAGAVNPLIETHQPQRPSALLADAINANGLTTTFVTWQASPTPGITGYNVYGRRDDEPFLTQIGTSTGTYFDTGDLWSDSNGSPERVYAVSAVFSDGTESFLSDFVENNDRDHDGLSDGYEAQLGTDPDLADTDNDGLDDNEELNLGTSPLISDTDLDEFTDGDEVAVGANPLDDASYPGIADGDLNGDGIVDTADVLLANRILMGQIAPTQDQIYHGDVAPLVNGIPVSDGEFNIGDVLVIQRKALGMINF